VLSDKVLVLLQRMALCITRKYVFRLIGQRLCLQLMRAATCGVQINDLRAGHQRHPPPPPPSRYLGMEDASHFYFMHSDEICPQSTFVHSKKLTFHKNKRHAPYKEIVKSRDLKNDVILSSSQTPLWKTSVFSRGCIQRKTWCL
jgi:hypothetical protein